MKILVACEESQLVTKAFRKLEHEAFSCDPFAFSGDHPEWHLDSWAMSEVKEEGWDMVIAFPPCTHLCSSGARWFAEKRADGRQQSAINFFFGMINASAPRVCVENPIGIMSTHYRKPDQIIQPWQFGHGETKATCLWLRGLPLLVPTDVVEGREQKVWKMGPSAERGRLRSKTYTGIAKAMASQWGALDAPTPD